MNQPSSAATPSPNPPEAAAPELETNAAATEAPGPEPEASPPEPEVSPPEPEPESATLPTPAAAPPGVSLVNPRSQLRLARKAGQLALIVPAARDLKGKIAWADLLDHLKCRLKASEQFWEPGTDIQLRAADQLLDGRQLQAIAQTLADVGLKLRRVIASRRQTAVAAAAAGYSVEQQETEELQDHGSDSAEHWAEPLYLKSTLRSGAEVQHPGTVIVFGDVNPGSSVIASGDVLVLGRLRGIAHAGAQGNRSCQIMALQMEATQLRIADAIARPPETPPEQLYPEVAYMAASGIRLARAQDFFRTHSFSMGRNSWTD